MGARGSGVRVHEMVARHVKEGRTLKPGPIAFGRRIQVPILRLARTSDRGTRFEEALVFEVGARNSKVGIVVRHAEYRWES